MSAPQTKVNKVNAAAIQAAQTAIGVLAIIAPASGANDTSFNAPAMYVDTGLLQTDKGEGPAVEFGTYFINQSGNPCVVVRPNASVSGTYQNPAVPAVTAVSATAGSSGPNVAATLTVTAGHGLSTGDVVTIGGATGDTDLNGTFVVTVVSPTVFSIPVYASAGSYSTGTATITFLGVDFIGTGTSVVTPGSASAIADDYSLVVVQVVAGGTIATGPITLQASLDGGLLWGAPFTLTTATTYTPTVPVTGVSTGVVFHLGAGTLVTGDTWSCSVTGPQMSTGDLTSALAALKLSKLGYDLVLIHGSASTGLVAISDPWVTSLARQGKFPFCLHNVRHEYLPRPTAEADSVYQTSVSSIFANVGSINVCVGASAADMVSSVSGVTKAMPASLYIATRAESYPIGVDPAFVQNGPVANAGIYLPNGNPKWHDEDALPGLDSLTIRLSTLRTFSDRQGTYITNAYVLSSSGSNFVYIQNARVMNAGCQAVWSAMTTLLSGGYERSLKTGLITKRQAADWQARGQAVLDKAVAGQVSGALFIVSTQDVNLGNGPATITCTVKNESLGYVKDFIIGGEFANTLS